MKQDKNVKIRRNSLILNFKDNFPEESKDEKEEKNRIKIPKLKLKTLEPISPIRVRRFSQPLIPTNFNKINNDFVIKTSKTRKYEELLISPQNKTTKKKLNKDYLDKILSESRKLMTIIDKAKKKNMINQYQYLKKQKKIYYKKLI